MPIVTPSKIPAPPPPIPARQAVPAPTPTPTTTACTTSLRTPNKQQQLQQQPLANNNNNNINNHNNNHNHNHHHHHHHSDNGADICQFYHIHDKKLGEGGFAKVRLATHLATRQNVAIKCLDKIKLGPELPRIYNEIECLKKLKHCNIARLYQVFETPTVIYLVLEYCAGGELFDYIVSKSRLTEAESAQIIHDLMRVLDYIHSIGFAHRDLKPENVLFDERHQIKLIDFGLAANCSAANMATNKNQQPLDQLSTCCGSVTYAAPEIISGGLYSGTSVDVWSAGVMLYALLVGQLPFNDSSISKLYQKIQAGVKSLPEFLSAEACDLIRKMLTVDPKRRISVGEVLAHPWLKNRVNKTARISRRLEFGPGDGVALDEHILARCAEKFAHLTLDQLRDFVRQDFNYIATTYHLIRSKCPTRAQAVKRTPDRQPIVPPTAGILSPRGALAARVAAAAAKAAPDTNPFVSPVKKTRFVTVKQSPQVARTPPSYLKHLQASKNGSQSARQAARHAATKHLALGSAAGAGPTPPVSQQLGASNLSPASLAAMLQNPVHAQAMAAAPANAALSPITNRHHHKRPTVLYGAPTPKKSIVKRLLESATPAKLRQPRKVLLQSDLMNITLTRYRDPNLCLDHFEEALRQKGFQCKRKDFSLKCFNQSIRLTLEVCIYNNQCAVQRKRIKGDAWQYKLVCEEILRISNKITQPPSEQQ